MSERNDTNVTPIHPGQELVGESISQPRSVLSLVGDRMRFLSRITGFEVHEVPPTTPLSVVGLYHPSGSYISEQPVLAEAYPNHTASLVVCTLIPNDAEQATVKAYIAGPKWGDMVRHDRTLLPPGEVLESRVELGQGRHRRIALFHGEPRRLTVDEPAIAGFIDDIDHELSRFILG